MSLCTCKCLNIRIKIISEEDPKAAARVTDCEQRDPFFREALLSCQNDELSVEIAQSALVTIRRVDAWSVHVCIACGTHTHAIGPHTYTLLDKAAMTTVEAVERLKCSPAFSPVFKLLVPEITSEDSKENIDANKGDALLIPSVPTLSKQLSRSLQSELESIEESIRLFRDQKYAEYEVYRERANRDHRILASIVTKARQAERRAGGQPPSPPPPLEFRRRLSSFKGVKKLKQSVSKPTGNMGSEEDSLDSEDIFDLEEANNGNNSDADDYDSDDSGSNDEGIGVRGSAVRTASQHVARSLPMSVPTLALHIHSQQPDDEDDPQDIAASIKALAQSVHGDVFGDLPRPRFSTQI